MSEIKNKNTNDWEKQLFELLQKHSIKFLPFVPDAGHAGLIALSENSSFVRPVVLTTEEEGIAFSCGAWLGGQKGVVLMQSSGLGNCINSLASISIACSFPLLMIITMRGEWNEFNPWQVPMGSSTEKVLAALNIITARCNNEYEVAETVNAMLGLVYKSNCVTAVLLSQRLIGAKSFME